MPKLATSLMEGNRKEEEQVVQFGGSPEMFAHEFFFFSERSTQLGREDEMRFPNKEITVEVAHRRKRFSAQVGACRAN